MRKRKYTLSIVVFILSIFVIISIFNGEESYISRESKIPSDATKVKPEEDFFPPILHSYEYKEPIPMPGLINTAGGEDSPFITYDGNFFYFFFTPDVDVSPEEQVSDEVTGIYVSNYVDGEWNNPVRVILQDRDKLALDGCPFVKDDTMWFCSAREGYVGVRFFTAQYVNGEWENWEYIGDKLMSDYEVGELHVTAEGNELYFHSQREGGSGQLDVWYTRYIEGEWQEPVNVEVVNSRENEGWPFITEDGNELWFTRFYKGYPAIFRSKKIDDEWQEPELILSQFAAEPTLDNEGNIYFAHHFFEDGHMIEADIYVAFRKVIESFTPVDSIELPPRGFFKGFLPFPSEGQDFDEVYEETSISADFVPIWGRPTHYFNLSEELNGSWGEVFLQNLTRGNGLFPIIHFSFIDAGVTLQIPSDIYYASLSDPEWRQSYKKAVVEVLQVTKPLYLSLGNEVNRWYEKYGAEEGSPNGFQHFVSLYEEIYYIVKELSPETQVFCVFAREIVSELREAELEVLNMFNPDTIDILVFTSYPYAVKGINKPEDIPDDYYKKVFNYFPEKPFGFTEITWPSLVSFGGEEGQADFLIQITNRLTIDQGIDLHLIGWSWLHDITEDDSTGLKERDGSAKLAFEVWKNL
jgi:hypothetical protein